MPITAKYFSVPKDGSPPEHNDDAVAADQVRRRFAVSDGATESGFSRLWSRLLVDQFVLHSNVPPEEWSAWLPATQQLWLDSLQRVKLPYYGEEQFRQGSFATFLGLVLYDDEKATCHWQAVAVGDSCLFHTRQNGLLKSFPLEKSSQFDSFPRLVGSRSSVTEIAEEHSLRTQGSGKPDDRLWLMSDALSQWCLSEAEADRAPWQEMAGFLAPTSSDEEFAGWVDQLRAARGLRNDDVTVMAIHL